MQLRRARGGAERHDEATAPLVELDPVQDAACELVLADEHALDRERARILVERAGIRPRAAVDVVDERVPVALEVVETLELACADVPQPVDRDRLDLARS